MAQSYVLSFIQHYAPTHTLTRQNAIVSTSHRESIPIRIFPQVNNNHNYSDSGDDSDSEIYPFDEIPPLVENNESEPIIQLIQSTQSTQSTQLIQQLIDQPYLQYQLNLTNNMVKMLNKCGVQPENFIDDQTKFTVDSSVRHEDIPTKFAVTYFGPQLQKIIQVLQTLTDDEFKQELDCLMFKNIEANIWIRNLTTQNISIEYHNQTINLNPKTTMGMFNNIPKINDKNKFTSLIINGRLTKIQLGKLNEIHNVNCIVKLS